MTHMVNLMINMQNMISMGKRNLTMKKLYWLLKCGHNITKLVSPMNLIR